MCGRIIPNFVADYIGPYNLLIPIFYSCSILLFAMFGVTNVPAVIIFSFLYGFATGSGMLQQLMYRPTLADYLP